MLFFCTSYDDSFAARNAIQFTPTQIEAIRAGMQPGLTMVVGPPGTGKTDVAVQIISNIYHNFPNQRMLVVTHSNQVCLFLNHWYSDRLPGRALYLV